MFVVMIVRWSLTPSGVKCGDVLAENMELLTELCGSLGFKSPKPSRDDYYCSTGGLQIT